MGPKPTSSRSLGMCSNAVLQALANCRWKYFPSRRNYEEKIHWRVNSQFTTVKLFKTCINETIQNTFAICSSRLVSTFLRKPPNWLTPTRSISLLQHRANPICLHLSTIIGFVMARVSVLVGFLGTSFYNLLQLDSS